MPTAHADRSPPADATAMFVTDGGLETDLIFRHGLNLPDFAAFPLLDSPDGREHVRDYYAGYAAIADRAGAGLMLETPTWRANPEWATGLRYGRSELDRINRAAITYLQELARSFADDHPGVGRILVGGTVGPRGDGYLPGRWADPEQAAEYHAPQLESFAAAGADLATAYTLTGVEEAAGVALAARSAGIAVAVSFTVETDGRLASGAPLGEAIEAVDQRGEPDYFLLNCAHPDHISAALSDGPWRSRIEGLRPNASRLSHAELNAADELDDGDPRDLADTTQPLREQFPALRILGGCCGTDARHVAALWAGR